MHVPQPDLKRFDQFLSTGGQYHVETNDPGLALKTNLKQLRLPTMLAEFEKLAGKRPPPTKTTSSICCA